MSNEFLCQKGSQQLITISIYPIRVFVLIAEISGALQEKQVPLSVDIARFPVAFSRPNAFMVTSR